MPLTDTKTFRSRLFSIVYRWNSRASRALHDQQAPSQWAVSAELSPGAVCRLALRCCVCATHQSLTRFWSISPMAGNNAKRWIRHLHTRAPMSTAVDSLLALRGALSAAHRASSMSRTESMKVGKRSLRRTRQLFSTLPGAALCCLALLRESLLQAVRSAVRLPGAGCRRTGQCGRAGSGACCAPARRRRGPCPC